MGLLNANVLPLDAALQIFELKADSLFATGRWLWVCSAEALAVLDAWYEKWARALIGANQWRNAAVIMSELGWHLSGWQRALKAAAMRRVRLAMLPHGDIYKDAADRADALGCGWTACSKCLLDSVGIVDWSVWADSGGNLKNYKAHVTQILLAAGREDWYAEVDRHSSQIPYRLFQAEPSSAFKDLPYCDLSWSERLSVRCWCQLRAGLFNFRHLNGRLSQAKYQHCIFCSSGVRNATVHVLGKCTRWVVHRAVCFSALGLVNESCDVVALAFLQVRPGHVAFKSVLHFCCALAEAEKEYWSTH